MGATKILLVEDNELNVKLIRALMQLGNIYMFEAGDAEKGIEVARQEMPDLILMDIQLPGMDGLTATRKIKVDDDLRHIPVVALSGFNDRKDIDKATEAGCDGYIAKPIDVKTFLQDVQGFLR
ncbi:MAG: response regulator [Desulfobacterales bacterium]|nr:response regulator [Desulfobacterales bacterium]